MGLNIRDNGIKYKRVKPIKYKRDNPILIGLYPYG